MVDGLGNGGRKSGREALGIRGLIYTQPRRGTAKLGIVGQKEAVHRRKGSQGSEIEYD